jgi:predicted ABC-type exoprotein transport system permease subunit
MTNFLKDSLLYLYAAALFLSAALLFLVQPMVAKMILPFLGGSSAVWITCLFFFQSFLLLG